MPRGKASKTGTNKATRATRSNKRDKPPDEDDDWSTPSDLALTSHPAKKLHYSLDALLQEKANAPPPTEEAEDSEGEDKEMEDAEIEEDLDLLTREGYKNIAQVREMLKFDDELKKLDQYLNLLPNPYEPLSMLPTFATPLSPRNKGLKRQNSSNLEDAHEQALKTICRMFSEESSVVVQVSSSQGDDSDDEDDDSLAVMSSLTDVAADGITLYTLIQPINNFLQRNDSAWGIGTSQNTTCRVIASWLLSIIAFHPQTTISGSIFSLFSRALLGAPSLSTLPGIYQPPSLTPPTRSSIFWANLLSPAAFYRIWRAYGVEFVKIDTSKEEDEDSFFVPSVPTLPSTPSLNTTTTTTTTTSTDDISSSPASGTPTKSPKSKSPRAKKGKGKATEEEKKKPAVEKPPPNPPTFPSSNFILITHLLQLCTELNPTSFSQQSLRTLLNQTFQFMLDAKTSNTPSLTHLFESLLYSYLQLPPGHKRDQVYTVAQLLRDLCADFASVSDAHRIWVRGAQAVPITSAHCTYLRVLLSLTHLHSLTTPPLPLPSPFSPSYLSDLISYLCAALEVDHKDDAVLLSAVQFVELTLGPELGPVKSQKEIEKLIKALQNMNKRVKDAGLFGLVRTRAKDSLVSVIGILSASDGKRD